MSKHACEVHTHQRKCLIDDYSQLSCYIVVDQTLLTVKKISQIERNRKNLSTRIFFTWIIFNVKISLSMVAIDINIKPHPYNAHALP